MNIRLLITAMALSLTTSLAFAQQQEHEQHHPDEVSAQAAAPSEEPSLEPTIEQLEAAQAQWDKIMQTQDPEERHRLMMEYRQKMHDSIATMRAMHQAQRERMRAHATPEAMRQMHARGAQSPGRGAPMRGMMERMHSGGQGMRDEHHSMMMGMTGMMEAYRQMDKRLDLIQDMVQQLLEEQDDRE